MQNREARYIEVAPYLLKEVAGKEIDSENLRHMARIGAIRDFAIELLNQNGVKDRGIKITVENTALDANDLPNKASSFINCLDQNSKATPC